MRTMPLDCNDGAALRVAPVKGPDHGIAQFVSCWVSASGYRLRIKKVRKDQASVDFLDPRPFGAPT